MVLGHVFLGGVGGKDVDGVEVVGALPLMGGGSSAGVHGDASKGRLEFVVGARVDGNAWPTKGMDLEASIECTCFGVELGKDETYGAHRRVSGLPLFATVVARWR